MGVSLLGSTPSSSSTTLSSSSNSSISSLSSSISSSSSGEERRKGGGEEFIGREEEEGEVVSISIVTIAEESCSSEPFGTVGGHVEVTANESAAKDGQSKTSHSTQTEEEGVRNGEEEEEGRKEDDEKEQGDEGEEEEAEETDEERRNQVFVSDENPETPSALLNIKVRTHLSPLRA